MLLTWIRRKTKSEWDVKEVETLCRPLFHRLAAIVQGMCGKRRQREGRRGLSTHVH